MVTGTYTYTLTCSNALGATSATVEVHVVENDGRIPPPPGTATVNTDEIGAPVEFAQPMPAGSVERTLRITRTTYILAGQAIATRITGDPDENDGRYYLHSDHLGSVSAMSDANGDLVGEVTRYTPFGGYRSSDPNPITDRAFTGQRENMADLGLYYYNARWYSPSLAHFLSADAIVPNPTSPQSLNRYTYVLNSPLKFRDPTGHRECASIDTPCSPAPLNSSNLETIESWQRRNALLNNMIAWPTGVASQSTIVTQVRGLAPISQGPLNEIQFLPNGSFVQVPGALAKASTVGSYGLPIISGALNQAEIHERLESGDLTSREATLETVNNGLFTGGTSFTSGYVTPELAAASSVTVSSGWLALGVIAMGYDLNVAQGTINNMIEGQDLGTAFHNSRAVTNDRFTFGHGQELENALNQGTAIVANFIIWAIESIREN